MMLGKIDPVRTNKLRYLEAEDDMKISYILATGDTYDTKIELNCQGPATRPRAWQRNVAAFMQDHNQAEQDGVQFLDPDHPGPGRRRIFMAQTTYILPDLPWAVLLGPILRDARAGDRIVVYTDAMRERVEHAVQVSGRTDLIIQQVAPPLTPDWA